MNSLGIEFLKQGENIEDKINNLYKEINLAHHSLKSDPKTKPTREVELENNNLNLESYKYFNFDNQKPMPLKHLCTVVKNLNRQITQEKKPSSVFGIDPSPVQIKDPEFLKLKSSIEEMKKFQIERKKIKQGSQQPVLNDEYSNQIIRSSDFESNPLPEILEEYSLMFSANLTLENPNMFNKDKSHLIRGIRDEVLSSYGILKDSNTSRASIDYDGFPNQMYNSSHNYMNTKGKLYTPFKNKNTTPTINYTYNVNKVSQQPDSTSLSYTLNKRTKEGLHENKDFNGLLREFHSQLNQVKIYFAYCLTGNIVTKGVSFDSRELDKCVEKEKLLSVVVGELIVDLQKRMQEATKLNGSVLSHLRSKVTFFKLLQSYLQIIGKRNAGSTTVNSLVIAAIQSLQTNFLSNVISDHSYNGSNSNMINKDLSKIDLKEKVKAIEAYVSHKIVNTSAYKSSTDKKAISFWANVYFMLRAGLDFEVETYINKGTNEGMKEDGTIRCFIDLLSYHSTSRNSGVAASKYSDSKMESISRGYSALLKEIRDRKVKSNPFEYACYCIVLKVNNEMDQELFDDMDDYFWFHLRLISLTQDRSLISSIPEASEIKLLQLSEFQGFIKASKSEFETNINSDFDIARLYMSIGLIADAVRKISTKEENLVDSFNIGYILHQTGLLVNYESIFNQVEAEHNIDALIVNRDTIIADLMQRVMSNFAKASGPDLLLYLISNAMVDSPIHSKGRNGYIKSYNKEEELNLAIKVNKSAFKTEFPNYLCKDRFIEVLLKSNSIGLLSSIDSCVYSDESTSIQIRHLIPSAELFESLVQIILEREVSLNKVVLVEDIRLELALKSKLYENLLNLLTNNCIFILKDSVPQKILNSSVHESKGSLVESKSKIKGYKKYFDAIGLNMNHYNQQFKNKYEFLLQLEMIEEIYLLIVSGKHEKALQNFFDYNRIIPFKGTEEIAIALEKIETLEDSMKRIIPEIIYLFVALCLIRKNEITSSPTYSQIGR